MKKILIAICLIVSVNTFSQNIDTIRVRNLQLKYEEWSWLIGGINPFQLDSLSKKQYKKLTKFLDEANPAGFGTNITYDSLPGRFALFFFQEYWKNHEARDNMGTGIDTKIRAYTPLSGFIAAADAARLQLFTSRRNFGRDIIE